MKKFTLLMVALLLSVMGVNAKTKTTTLWEDTYEDNIEIDANSLKAGTITVYMTWSGSEGCGLSVWYCVGTNWTRTDLSEAAKQGMWQNNGTASYSFTISADEITTISSSAAQKLFFATDDKVKMTINKIELTTEVPTANETELLNGSWPGSWTQKNFDAQSSAKIGDVIRLSYTCTSGAYVQINFLDNSGNGTFTGTTTLATNIYATSGVFDYEITCYDDMVKVQTGGFAIKGADFTLTSVKLLTYEDSYDAVSITVGSDGIATYSNGGKNVQISACDALKAYYASAVTPGKVTLTELTCIPASQGAIVKGTAGTYTVKVGGEGWEDLTNKNYLKPSNGGTTVTASTDGTYHYIFAKKSSGTPAFYKLATAAHNLAAHKAYLETTEDITPTSNNAQSGNAPSIMLDFGDGTTAIMDVFQDEMKQQLAQEDNVYYTLQGTRVQNPTKGLYILNGKKIIVK